MVAGVARVPGAAGRLAELRRFGRAVSLRQAGAVSRARSKLYSRAVLPPTMPSARRTRPRPQRWAAAVAALIELQDEYRAWLDSLPASLESSRLAEKLNTIVEFDLEELQAIDLPRGYGRD